MTHSYLINFYLLLAVEPKNYAAVVMVAVASSDEPGEEKLILSETNDQTKIQISTQPKSEIVKPTTSSHKIPTQHLNEDVTIHATDSITERVKKYVYTYTQAIANMPNT